MDVPTPGIEIFARLGFVTKTKRTFDVGFIHPIDLPVFWKDIGLGIVIASNAEDRYRAALPPFFYCAVNVIRQAFGAMHEVAENEDAFGARFFDDLCEFIEITIKDCAGNGDAVLLKNLGLAPVSVGKNQRFFRVPVDRFAPVEGKLLSPYFC